MKNSIIHMLISALILFIFTGCAPRLARTKYGTTENQWKGYIKESYKDWEPPPTPPPINDSKGGHEEAGSFTLDIVPEPVPGKDLIIAETDVNPDSIQTAADPDLTLYTVKKGDTLWSISCDFYNNDGSQWKKIQEANKDIISSPGSIKPGLTLTIPSK
jgi:LysM repeat protein